MTLDNELRARLERELGGIPAVPATAYLHEGRRARRRRRAVTGLVAAPVLALGAGVGSLLFAGGDDGPSPAREAQVAETPPTADPVELGPDPDFVAPEPNNPVEAVAGLDGIDWFTTEDVPEWAMEYGNHGPVALSPNGRLWVAPDTVVRRVVVDPYRPGDGGTQPITASYAVEAQYLHAPEEKARVVWMILSTDGTGPGVGTIDETGRWTDDFELWVDNETAHQQGRPSFAERLARFARVGSSQLVPGANGVQILRQVEDPAVDSGWEPGIREAAAEVKFAGQRWYVHASDPRDGGAWYIAHDGDAYPDFDAFLADLAGDR